MSQFAQQPLDDEADTTYGLAQMKKHWKAEDGQIEECSDALWDSWPVQEALKKFPDDPEPGHTDPAQRAAISFARHRERFF